MAIDGNRSVERTLTTHVGSLVRPDDLVAALKARRDGGELHETAFDDLLSRSVTDVVRR